MATAITPATPVAMSKIAQALGLEGQLIRDLSIHMSNDHMSTVVVSMGMTADQERRMAGVLKEYSLVERKAR